VKIDWNFWRVILERNAAEFGRFLKEQIRAIALIFLQIDLLLNLQYPNFQSLVIIA
jgi:hypothetical protein